MEHPAQRQRTGTTFKAFYLEKESKNGWQGLRSLIISLDDLEQKQNPWKRVSFPGINRGWKGGWNGNIPYRLKIYTLLQCSMSSTFS
jgi:hypothetical protein